MSDDDVRSVRGGSWYESYGGCGGGVLTRQTRSGVARMVRVPGREGALALLGTRGDDLVRRDPADRVRELARPGRAVDLRPRGAAPRRS